MEFVDEWQVSENLYSMFRIRSVNNVNCVQIECTSFLMHVHLHGELDLIKNVVDHSLHFTDFGAPDKDKNVIIGSKPLYLGSYNVFKGLASKRQEEIWILVVQ